MNSSDQVSSNFQCHRKTFLQHWMLIIRAISIENENVNLEKGTTETVKTQSACLRASWVVMAHTPGRV